MTENFSFSIMNSTQTAEAINAFNFSNTEKPIEEHTTIAFVGDIMLDRGVKGMVNKYFNGDYNQVFVNAPELKEYDILFGNLEGPVSDKGRNVGSIYSFRMDTVIPSVLKDVGFDIVSFANNHVGDWSTVAFVDTLSRLKDAGILYTGAGINKESAEKVTIIEKNKTKFGFIGFSDVGPNWISAKENSPGILIAEDPNFGEIIKKAKSEVDVLIVSFHWGDEYEILHNTRQENLAHSAIDFGADIVVGHHPHVIQDVQNYKDKIIIYSLGNFVFDQYFSTNTMQGMMYTIKFDGKNIIDSKNHLVQLNKRYQIESIE